MTDASKILQIDENASSSDLTSIVIHPRFESETLFFSPFFLGEALRQLIADLCSRLVLCLDVRESSADRGKVALVPIDVAAIQLRIFIDRIRSTEEEEEEKHSRPLVNTSVL